MYSEITVLTVCAIIMARFSVTIKFIYVVYAFFMWHLQIVRINFETAKIGSVKLSDRPVRTTLSKVKIF